MTNPTTHPAADHKTHEAASHPAKNAGGQVTRPPSTAEATELKLLEANWKQISAKMKEKWSVLTDDELRFVDKTKAALIAKVRERTGLEPDETERQVEALILSISPTSV